MARDVQCATSSGISKLSGSNFGKPVRQLSRTSAPGAIQSSVDRPLKSTRPSNATMYSRPDGKATMVLPTGNGSPCSSITRSSTDRYASMSISTRTTPPRDACILRNVDLATAAEGSLSGAISNCIGTRGVMRVTSSRPLSSERPTSRCSWVTVTPPTLPVRTNA